MYADAAPPSAASAGRAPLGGMYADAAGVSPVRADAYAAAPPHPHQPYVDEGAPAWSPAPADTRPRVADQLWGQLQKRLQLEAQRNASIKQSLGLAEERHRADRERERREEAAQRAGELEERCAAQTAEMGTLREGQEYLLKQYETLEQEYQRRTKEIAELEESMEAAETKGAELRALIQRLQEQHAQQLRDVEDSRSAMQQQHAQQLREAEENRSRLLAQAEQRRDAESREAWAREQRLRDEHSHREDDLRRREDDLRRQQGVREEAIRSEGEADRRVLEDAVAELEEAVREKDALLQKMEGQVDFARGSLESAALANARLEERGAALADELAAEKASSDVLSRDVAGLEEAVERGAKLYVDACAQMESLAASPGEAPKPPATAQREHDVQQRELETLRALLADKDAMLREALSESALVRERLKVVEQQAAGFAAAAAAAAPARDASAGAERAELPADSVAALQRQLSAIGAAAAQLGATPPRGGGEGWGAPPAPTPHAPSPPPPHSAPHSPHLPGPDPLQSQSPTHAPLVSLLPPAPAPISPRSPTNAFAPGASAVAPERAHTAPLPGAHLLPGVARPQWAPAAGGATGGSPSRLTGDASAAALLLLPGERGRSPSPPAEPLALRMRQAIEDLQRLTDAPPPPRSPLRSGTGVSEHSPLPAGALRSGADSVGTIVAGRCESDGDRAAAAYAPDAVLRVRSSGGDGRAAVVRGAQACGNWAHGVAERTAGHAVEVAAAEGDDAAAGCFVFVWACPGAGFTRVCETLLLDAEGRVVRHNVAAAEAGGAGAGVEGRLTAADAVPPVASLAPAGVAILGPDGVLPPGVAVHRSPAPAPGAAPLRRAESTGASFARSRSMSPAGLRAVSPAGAASAVEAGAELLPAGVADELARLRRQVVSPANLEVQEELRDLRRRAVEAAHLDDRLRSAEAELRAAHDERHALAAELARRQTVGQELDFWQAKVRGLVAENEGLRSDAERARETIAAHELRAGAGGGGAGRVALGELATTVGDLAASAAALDDLRRERDQLRDAVAAERARAAAAAAECARWRDECERLRRATAALQDDVVEKSKAHRPGALLEAAELQQGLESRIAHLREELRAEEGRRIEAERAVEDAGRRAAAAEAAEGAAAERVRALEGRILAFTAV